MATLQKKRNYAPILVAAVLIIAVLGLGFIYMRGNEDVTPASSMVSMEPASGGAVTEDGSASTDLPTNPMNDNDADIEIDTDNATTR